MPAQNQESANNYPDLITHLLAYLLSLTPSIHMNLEDIAVISRQNQFGGSLVSLFSAVWGWSYEGVTRVTICDILFEKDADLFFLWIKKKLGPARNKSESWRRLLMLLILAQLMVSNWCDSVSDDMLE